MTEPQQQNPPDWMAETSVGIVLTLFATWYVYVGNMQMVLLFMSGLLTLAVARIIVREGIV